MTTTPSPIRSAATVILMRDVPGAMPELLMLERGAGMTFAAGAMVFPGGTVDPADEALAAELRTNCVEPPDEIAARIAAIRETLEEAGILIGATPLPDAALVTNFRDELAAGRALHEIFLAAGLAFALDALAPFARWHPPAEVKHRFDTRFYLAEAPPGAVETADGGESVHALWASARQILDHAEEGHHRLIFPTRCMLERLAQFASLAEARADAGRHRHHLIQSWIEAREDGDWLCIPENAGYPLTALPLDRALRG